MQDYFAKNKIQAITGHYEVDKRTICYASIGEDHLPAILFVHGAPGSIKDFLPFYTDPELIKRFSIYAIDRPGYGLTDGEAESRLQKQSEMIAVLAERIHRVHQPLVIVAQDYGALIAARVAMDHPKFIQGLVLLDMMLREEKKTGIVTLLKQMFFDRDHFSSFQSAAIEKKNQSRDLKKMSALWKKITIPVICLCSEKNTRTRTDQEFLKLHIPQMETVHLKSSRRKFVQQKEREIREKILNIFQLIQPH